VCLDLKVINFTDIISTQFTITFDPGVLQYQSITNFNPMATGLDIADFGTTTAGLGYITFIWSDGQPCQNAVTGITIPDDQVLFRLCFIATGDYGFHTPVEITSSPIDRITRRATAQCFDIGELVCNSFVSIGTSPLKINISSADGFYDDVVCLDFKVKDFTDLISAQYFVFWDTSILTYVSSMKMNLGSMGDVYDIFHSPAFGMLASVWYNNSLNQGVTLPDGTQILQMCFRIKGNCGQSAPVYISQNFNSSPPEPIEIIDAVTAGSPTGTNIGLLSTPGTVSVNCLDPNSITVEMDDKNVCPGESFTVDVKVQDFSQIVEMTFDLKWNPGVIDLTQVSYPTQPGGPACLPFSTGVDQSDVNTGLLHMNWITQGQGCNKPDGFIVMRLHFMANGPSGSNSTIAVVNPIFVDKFGGQPVNIGINNYNSLVTLCNLDQPTIIAESASANPGTTVCLDFTVLDFDDITGMEYTIAWEPTVMQFTGIQGLNLTNLSMSNFQTAQAGSLGVLGLDWSNPMGVNVPDGVSIFTACFNLIGDPGDCTDIVFDDAPWPIVINTATPNAGNVGLNGQPGEVCILDPFILNLSLPTTFAGQFSNICLDLTVENFNQLTNTEYSINWDPTILSFQGVTPTGALPNFGPSSYDASDAAGGNLTIDWAATNQVLGTSVPDGTSIFQLCFQVIGNPGKCSPLTISGFPQAVLVNSATTGNASLNISTQNGSVCVGGSINLVSYAVTDVSCGANPDGAIALTVNGGSGQYGYQWSGPGVNPTAAGQSNINVGYYIVTITDTQNPLLNIIQPFSVGYTVDATYANAGQDTTRSCGTNELTLNGTGSSMAPGTTYNWVKLGLGLITGGATTLTPQVIGSGAFEITVSGPNGCVDKDTVFVGGTQTPVPTIAPAPLISCKQDTVILDGTLSPFGFQIQWTGPAVVPGTENFLTPKVTAPGWYFLTLSNPSTNCAGMDSIEVFGDLMPPIADAGLDTVLGCSTPFVPIGGASSTGSNIEYDWVPVGGGQLCGNPQAATLNACSPGIFELTVLDTLNGCSAIDVVAVTADTLKPISNPGPTMTINCAVDTVTLDGSASSSNGNFSYTWTFLGDNSVVSQTTTATVSVPGMYQLEVMDNSNNCQGFSVVTVNGETTPPIIVANHSNDISCLEPSAILDATGSATGANISYEWFNGAGASVGTGLTLNVTIPDTYQLVVTNSANQCSSSENEVVLNLLTPPAANAGMPGQIDCNGPAVLQGTYDSTNLNLQIQWTGPGLGCIQNGNTTSPTASCPGTYTMQVYDNITGCVGTSTTTVSENTLKPSADAGPDQGLPCAGSSVTLNGSTDATDFTVTWGSVPAGLPIGDATTLNPTVTQAGTYSLSVQSNINGCISTTDLVVVTVEPINLVANAGNDTATDCQNLSVTLDASGSTLSGGNTVLWQLLDGTFVSDQVTVEVMAGTYELVITTPGGCEARDTTVVSDISEQFIASASASGQISCDNPTVTLTGSSTSTGTNLTLVWRNESGMLIGNGDTVSVLSPGNYTLTVTNTANNCTATATVSITEDNSGLEQAFAQADYVECDPDATLIGNLPSGTTGNWTSSTGANIQSPSAATTTASGFIAGQNKFVWTLSKGDCLNYSSDTVTITVNQATPNAVNDNTVLQPGSGGQVTINVLENDEFTAGNVVFSLLPYNSVFGVATSNSDGEVVFNKEKCVVGKVEIPYQICDLTCPDLCDEASLVIDVLFDPEEACGKTPNGITPNGDGINDELVFDELLNTSENYPDNEIVIFNRWGDVVYQAKPYQNNWGGTNNSGDELPHATYYYILRLNISDGKILRGDVTILK